MRDSEEEKLTFLITDLLMSTVAKMGEITGKSHQMPSRAVLIYEVVDTDGERKVDWTATRDITLTDAAGFAHFVREQAMMDLFDLDEED